MGAAEVAPGRLFPWLASPSAPASSSISPPTASRHCGQRCRLPHLLLRLLSWHGAALVGLPLALGFACLAAGFAVATLNTARLAHPVLRIPASSVNLTGFVEVREERERSDRIVVHVHHLDGRTSGETPERVRVAVRKDTAPPGRHIRVD